MRLIIAGSRHFKVPITLLEELVSRGYNFLDSDLEIVSGGARGVDELGEDFAKKLGLKLTVFEADWDKFGRKAGPLRNKQMAEYADCLLLIWDGESKGSKNMKNEMMTLDKPMIEVIFRNN